MEPWGEPVEDEFSELVDADLPRADLVGKGANGVPFLVAKADAGGLVPAEMVRRLAGRRAPNYTREEAQMFNVLKANKDQPVAVYDAQGRLVGTVDQSMITVLQDGSSMLPDPKAKPIPSPTSAGAVQDGSELQPAPADSVGVPADAQRTVAKSADGRRAQRDAAETVADRERVDRVSGAAAASQLGTMLKARRALAEYKAATARRR